MRGGYIKLHRRFTKWGWYNDPNTARVFIHLLLTASWEECEYHGHKIKPGQVVTGRKMLAKDLKMSEKQIRTALEHLQSTNEITIQVTNRFSIITVVNWGKYQVLETERASKGPADSAKKHEKYKKSASKTASNGPATPIEISSDTAHVQPTKGQQSGQQGANKGPAKGHIKEYKNIKEVGGQPSFDSVLSLFKERGYKSNPQRFFDYYQGTGWKRKNGKVITDWVKVAEEWELREKEPPKGKSNVPFIQEPPKYKEFEPEPEKERTQMPDSIRNKFKVVKGGAE